MPAHTVECFYSLSSPWMYLGGPQLTEIIRRHNAKLLLRPYDFRLVIKHTGGIPLRSRPEPRQDYHALELDRWSRHLGVPLKLKPAHYPPTDQRPAGRMVMAAQQRGMDAMALSHAILRALWAEERDIADPHERVKIADEMGLPGQHLQAAEDSASISAEWEKNNQDAIAKGVFGAPTFLCGDLFLWGQDRLFFLDEHLAGQQVQSAPSAKIRKLRAS
ncbi:2-hydroxychromene-2-carboxylate isomerase [Roseomonas hellenica]|uniref:2-hydroxychromene-2-carboxylate isomerase n=1 Tax=Plastoroseomonas hellenica TaxID=2687306 RepID=A0ABS5F6R3_9PROT|nr:2-hydroxychromene-2-carboxylate isomerase [Plastoroseomonas hellenica]MBR0668186.1 2-hydroxychromene-2-carboxylate isomerase [Plastoroseomonas hellenica]